MASRRSGEHTPVENSSGICQRETIWGDLSGEVAYLGGKYVAENSSGICQQECLGRFEWRGTHSGGSDALTNQ